VPETDWLLFTERYPPLGSDLSTIHLLLADEAERLWAAMINDVDRKYGSYRDLPPGHRLNRAKSFGPNWYTYANDPLLPDTVAEFLRSRLAWPPEQTVFYAHSPRYTFGLPWTVFLQHWRRFMQLDESFVFAPGRPDYALFADGGWLSVGRTTLEAEPAVEPDGF